MEFVFFGLCRVENVSSVPFCVLLMTFSPLFFFRSILSFFSWRFVIL